MPSQPYSIRRLIAGDVRLLRALNGLFAAAFNEPRTYLASAPSDAWLESLLSKEHNVVLVALAGSDVVGGLVSYELDKFEQERREFYIYDLAVAESHRRQGIATALMAELGRIARERCAWVIYVQADYGDEPAIALYEKLGAREDVMHFDIAVDGQERS